MKMKMMWMAVVIALAVIPTVGVNAQDVMTIGSVTTGSTTVNIPIYVRDVSGTELGVDQATGARIQGLAFKVVYTPSTAVSSISFSRAGVLAGKTPLYEKTLEHDNSIVYVGSFSESSSPIGFTADKAAPGDQIGTLTIALSGTDGVELVFESATATLSNQAGTTDQTVADGGLALVGGTVSLSTAPFDFDHDNDNDIIWRNYGDGKSAVWYMAGAVRAGYGFFPTLADTNWLLAGTGDWNGDGSPDLLWRNQSTGKNAIWYMNGLSRSGYAYLADLPDLNWHIASVGDFDNDGHVDDILWRNHLTGANAYWYMANATRTGYAYLLEVTDLGWKIVGSADFDGDQDEDIVWRHDSTGKIAIWYMSGTTRASFAYAPTLPDANWVVRGVADFNGDQKPDLVWRNTSTGANAFWYMNNTARTGYDYLLKLNDQNWAIEGPR